MSKVGDDAIFAPSEWQPEDWAVYGSLTHLRICRTASPISSEHLAHIFQLQSLEVMQLSHERGALESSPGPGPPQLGVRLKSLHTLELAGLWINNTLVLECPRLLNMRLVQSTLPGHVGLAGCPQLRTLSFAGSYFSGGIEDWLYPELLHVQGLTALCLGSCILLRFPYEVLMMSALRHLDLAENHNTELPITLPPLECLDLSGRFFGEVPQIPKAVTSLSRLDLGRQESDCQVTHWLLPLLQRNEGLKVLTIGGSDRWSARSLGFVSEALQWLGARGREVDFSYELKGDGCLAPSY